MENPKKNFTPIWERIKTETEITSFSQLAELTGTTQQNISAAKKRDEFPVKWAFQIWLKYGYLVEWIMTGAEPKKIIEYEGRKQQEKLVQPTKPRYKYLDDLEEWARETSGSGNLEWFENLIDSYIPAFKTWREQRKSGKQTAIHEDQIDSRRVA